MPVPINDFTLNTMVDQMLIDIGEEEDFLDEPLSEYFSEGGASVITSFAQFAFNQLGRPKPDGLVIGVHMDEDSWSIAIDLFIDASKPQELPVPIGSFRTFDTANQRGRAGFCALAERVATLSAEVYAIEHIYTRFRPED